MNYEWERISFFLLFLFCSHFFSQLWTIREAGQVWNLRTGNIPCPLSFLSCFLPVLYEQSVSILFYPTLNFIVEGGDCGGGVVSC